MVEFKGIKNIIWDFDGVILDSMEVRELGFQKVLSDFPEHQVNLLLDYHNKNGGLSRYVKFRYFFQEIRGESPKEENITRLAEAYSAIMRKKLLSKDKLNKEVLEFIKKNYQFYSMHIVSGSDEKELQFLCESLSISKYFKSIYGSPTSKTENVRNLLAMYSYSRKETCLIGDSINDYDAALENKIYFLGYNNLDLIEKGLYYIHSFSDEIEK